MSLLSTHPRAHSLDFHKTLKILVRSRTQTSLQTPATKTLRTCDPAWATTSSTSRSRTTTWSTRSAQSTPSHQTTKGMSTLSRKDRGRRQGTKTSSCPSSKIKSRLRTESKSSKRWELKGARADREAEGRRTAILVGLIISGMDLETQGQNQRPMWEMSPPT